MYNQYITNMKTDKDCDTEKKKNEIRFDRESYCFTIL